MSALSTGSADRRRSTVSGPEAQLDHGDAKDENVHVGDTKTSPQSTKLPWSSPSAPASPHTASPSPEAKKKEHRRSISGNLLAKFNFLKSLGDDGRPASSDKDKEKDKERTKKKELPQSPKSPKSVKSRKSIDDDEPATSSASPVKAESAMAAALKNTTRTRKRKGSLRKTALLGPRRLVTETRERRNSILQRNPSSKQNQHIHADTTTTSTPGNEPALPSAEDLTLEHELRNRFSYENVSAASSSDSGWFEPPAVAAARLSLLTDSQAQQSSRPTSTDFSSPLGINKSPISQASYASTTDDDDVLTFDRPAKGFAAQQRNMSLDKHLSTGTTSYFPSLSSVSDASLSRRVSSKHRSSPLSHNITTLSTFPETEPHDYTETEYWGWVILIVTWLIFTVGMGSCLEIWSWAWDVGETPYAPPELEDDPTLPIVGYYPALIVLTGVVAWVWITVAWIGMKYFRHAKIEV